MKFVLLFFIKLYWSLIPENKRKCCLFRESCSKYVYRTTIEQGFEKGFKALLERYRLCKPGNHIIAIKEDSYLITKNFEIIKINNPQS